MLKLISQPVFVFLWHVSAPVYSKLNVQAVAIGTRRAYWFGSGFSLFGLAAQVQCVSFVNGQYVPFASVQWFLPNGNSPLVAVKGTRASRAVAARLV